MELDQYKPSTSTIIDGISVAVIFLVSLLFSISIYALFYWIWMPHAIFDYSANLHYQRDPQKGISASAVVDFSRGEFNKVLSSNQHYDAIVSYELPESEHNFALGSWMSTLKLLHVDRPMEMNNSINFSPLIEDTVREYVLNNGMIVSSASKPILLTRRSYWHDLIHTWIRMPGLIAGFFRESQNLRLTMIEDIVDSRNLPITHGVLTIFPPVSDMHNIADVISTNIILTASFSKIQYIMYHWFIPATITIILCLTIAQFSVYVVLWILMKNSEDKQEKSETRQSDLPQSPHDKGIELEDIDADLSSPSKEGRKLGDIPKQNSMDFRNQIPSPPHDRTDSEKDLLEYEISEESDEGLKPDDGNE